MSMIITDAGFAPANDRSLTTLAEITAQTEEVDLANTDDPEALRPYIDQLKLVRIAFPAFSDGRAFTVARRLRMAGYKGKLFALGPVIADQYSMLRRVGFDGAEVPDEIAQRQPEDQWKFRANWQDHHYQALLRA